MQQSNAIDWRKFMLIHLLLLIWDHYYLIILLLLLLLLFLLLRFRFRLLRLQKEGGLGGNMKVIDLQRRDRTRWNGVHGGRVFAIGVRGGAWGEGLERRVGELGEEGVGWGPLLCGRVGEMKDGGEGWADEWIFVFTWEIDGLRRIRREAFWFVGGEMKGGWRGGDEARTRRLCDRFGWAWVGLDELLPAWMGKCAIRCLKRQDGRLQAWMGR